MSANKVSMKMAGNKNDCSHIDTFWKKNLMLALHNPMALCTWTVHRGLFIYFVYSGGFTNSYSPRKHFRPTLSHLFTAFLEFMKKIISVTVIIIINPKLMGMTCTLSKKVSFLKCR